MKIADHIIINMSRTGSACRTLHGFLLGSVSDGGIPLHKKRNARKRSFCFSVRSFRVVRSGIGQRQHDRSPAVRDHSGGKFSVPHGKIFDVGKTAEEVALITEYLK